jgi:cytochrome P450
VAPPFQKESVASYCPRLAATSAQAIETWSTGKILDLWQEMRTLAIRLSTEVLFGLEDLEAAKDLGERLFEWLSESHSIGVRIFPVDIVGTPYRRMMKHAEEIETAVRSLVKTRAARQTESNDLISILAQAQANGHMTEGQMVGQIAFLFASSYETMSSALTWTLFLLSQHPSVMADLLDELNGVLRGGVPNSEQLVLFSLLDAVIKESMRLLPPVPYINRRATQPTELGGLHLNKGDSVLISHFVTHHQSDIYPDPERFIPQRWFTIHPSPYEYLPFGAGPRMCVGYHFAMTAMKIALSTILPRFRLTVVPGTRIDRSVHVTMFPIRGIPMVIYQQDRQFRISPVSGNIHEMVRLTEDN